MPGLLAVMGGGREAERLRRAADPVLRRPHHRLDTAADDSNGVALGFAGEHGSVASHAGSGVLVAFDGEFFDGHPVSGSEAAAIVLNGWLAHGAQWDPPDGWFTAAVWDPRTRELSLLTDHMGHLPLYVAQVDGATIVAGELKAVVAAGLEPVLDLEAWAGMLAYEHPLGELAPLEGVRAVPAATTLTIAAGGDRRERRRWRYRVEPASDGDEVELLNVLRYVLERSVDERLDATTGLALSGGLDSRSIATVVAANAPGTLALTWGMPGSEDFRYGAELARRAGLPHRPCPLEPGYIAAGARETVWLGEGHVRCFHAHHLVVRSLRDSDGLRSLLIGFSGDPVFRDYRGYSITASGDDALSADLHTRRASCVTDELLEEVFTTGFAAQLRGLARASLARNLTEEEGDPRPRVLQFVWNHNHRRKVLPAVGLFRDDLAPRDPLDDPELIALCRRMPDALRAGGRLQRAYLRGFPEIAAVRSPKDGLRPALVGRARRLAALRVKVSRRLRTEVEERLPVRWVPDHRGLADYATELRGRSAPVLDILLEERTLARGQLREATVRRFVSETHEGRARNTRALGMLLTFELFQRQFVDGDGFRAGGA